MDESKAVGTPLAAHFKLSKEQSPKSEKQKEYMKNVPYASAVGCLMYAMVCTRPNIAHAVGVVSRYTSNPGKQHWEAVKWIMRYLRGTTDMSLCFKRGSAELQGYVDADLAGDYDTCRSTTGYVYTVGGAAVSWVSNLQGQVALSTTESEYVAVSEAGKEMVWLKGLLEELGKKQENCALYSDSQSAIHLAKNPAFHSRTKHIPMKVSSGSWLESQSDISGHDLVGMEAFRNSLGPNTLGWSGSDYCNWTGVICNEDNRVSFITIRKKNLTGSIPASIGNIKYLKTFDVSENQLTGPLPRFRDLQLLERLLANNNNFTSIPVDFFSSDLPTLFSIDISHNPFAPWRILGAARELGFFSATNANIIGNLDAFSRINFPSLVNLDLSYNHVTGTVPYEFTQLPQLKYLDLSNNLLSGKVPEFRANVTVRLEGNSVMSSSSTRKMSARVLVVVLIGATTGLVLVLGLVVFFFRRKPGVVQLEASNTRSTAPGDIDVPAMDRISISVDVVRHATNNFSRDNLLGEGGFSSVFRAEIDGKIVAVKMMGRIKFGRVADEAIRSFEREVHVLTKVRHTNLVALLGYCWDSEIMILVYDYMPQGNLGRHLFHWRDEGLQPLAWATRLNIAYDVSRGVEYLHQFANQTFVHRDLKPSNILLTDDLHAKVADFGLVRPLRYYNATTDTTQPGGTAGYKAPEYALYRQISAKADVFSFGVILLELTTGKRAVDKSFPESDPHLPTWFSNQVINKGKGGIVWDELKRVIDPPIVSTDPNIVSSFLEIAKLAISCCNKDPNLRPDMTHVVNIIGPLVKPWKPSEPVPENLDPAADGTDWSIPLSEMVTCWERGEPSGQAGKVHLDSRLRVPSSPDYDGIDTQMSFHMSLRLYGLYAPEGSLALRFFFIL
ncbi:receptor-like kinase TMK3 [Rosa rugosa]|uniref:receptor-like kinase TMK3 n=1 Tax=Rosa rugosa TaxID=74645 RepID=UPI002B414180|nr:receptor-like kinase TMK3 [Rosa rugosa]